MSVVGNRLKKEHALCQSSSCLGVVVLVNSWHLLSHRGPETKMGISVQMSGDTNQLTSLLALHISKPLAGEKSMIFEVFISREKGPTEICI